MENTIAPELSITQSLASKSIGTSIENIPSREVYGQYQTVTNSPTITTTTTHMSNGSMYSPPTIPTVFRATIPFTLTMFACIEMVGYLAKKDGNDGKTEQNIKHFFSNVGLGISETEIEILVRIYRHGLAHNYFPKLNHAISYHKSDPSNALFFLRSDSDTKILNVNFLEDYFKIGLEKISQDPKLYQTMCNQYKRLIALYKLDKLP